MPKSKKLGSVLPAEAVGQSIGGPSGRLSTSLEIEDSSNENLKHRLHEWAASGARNDDEAGSEYEMLMDPNLPQEYETRRKGSGESGDEAALLSDDADDEEEENSPYPEVRAAVRNFDEDLPCNTVRAWTIGMLLVIVGASMNTLFSLRQPSISIGPLIAQIVAWPMGHGWAKFVPDREFTTFGITWTLNPGPFNVKEHAIIVVMASVSFSVAYATDIILAQVIFYKQDFGLVFQLLLTISTQSVGYGIAGMLRKFLGKLSLCHNDPSTNPGSLSRIHDLARESCWCNSYECHVRDKRYTRSYHSRRQNAQIQVVCHCNCMFLRILLHSRISGAISEHLCCGHLDGASESYCESAIRRADRCFASSYHL